MITHTYALCPVSRATYDEIRAKMLAANYHDHICTLPGSAEEVLDMHGIALQCEPEPLDTGPVQAEERA